MNRNLEDRAQRIKATGRKNAEKLFPRGKVKKVNVSETQTGSIRHETLPPELLALNKSLYNDIGRYFSPTLGPWEVGLIRDAFVQDEVRIYRQIAAACHAYHTRYTGGKRLQEPEEQKLEDCLSMISSGTIEPPKRYVPERTWRRLLECYLAAGEGD